MSRGMVSFLAGMGTGYIKARDKAYEQERQAKQDAWMEEQRSRQRQDWQEADAVKAGIKDASATRELSTGTVTEAGGQKLFSADPGQAAQVKSMVDSIAELEGSAPATQASGYAVTGPMSKGHKIGTGSAPDVATLNTPDAESQRVQDVYRKHGMRDKAMAEFTANEAYKKAIKERMTTFETEGVSKALGLLRMGAPEQAMEAFQKSGSVKLPEGSKFVQADGTDMFTGQPGKVWSVVGPDGKTIVADVGLAGAQYLGIADQFKFDGDLAKNRQTQANADREYGVKLAELEIKAQEAKSKDELREVQKQIYELRASRGGGSGGGQAATTGGPSVGLKERRDMLGDYGKLLPQPDGLDPETSQKTQLANAQALEQADAIFSMNAGVGSVLTAPQIMSAQRLAQNPANVKLLRDNETGQMYQTVIVSGQPVVVGVAQQKPQQEAMPQPAQPQAPTNKPGPMTAQMQKKTQVVQPADRNEFLQMQDAMRMGYEAVGRGNAMFGNGEVLYVNKKTGERKYASQLFSK